MFIIFFFNKSRVIRIRRISKQTVVNKVRKSKFKNAIKKMNLLIESKKKKKLWHYQGYYMDIVAVTDSKIYAERKIYSETFSIDRFSGTAVYSNGMMDPAEVTRYTCKKLDKLF